MMRNVFTGLPSTSLRQLRKCIGRLYHAEVAPAIGTQTDRESVEFKVAKNPCKCCIIDTIDVLHVRFHE